MDVCVYIKICLLKFGFVSLRDKWKHQKTNLIL